MAAAAVISASPALRRQLLRLAAAHLASAMGPTAPEVPVATEAVSPTPTVGASGQTHPSSSVETVVAPPPAAASRTATQPASRAPKKKSDVTPSAEEVALYSRALAQLNLKRDPAGALGTLDAYRFRYPDGMFQGEAAVARVRAEMALGRDAEALALLDAMHQRGFEGLSQVDELGLLRVELLVGAARCPEALPAVEAYLTQTAPVGQRERALFARASCRAQLKDFDGSREDLRDYLREFPHGRFAPKALQIVDSLH
jgi:TolA-binding protein